MNYPFNPKKLGTSYNEICRFNSFNKLVINHNPGWFKNETITFKQNTLPETFFSVFVDIGKIRQMKKQIPQPSKIK